MATSPLRSAVALLSIMAAGLASPSFAQTGDPRATTLPAAAPLGDAAAWRVPIHTAARDPVGGEYGVWTAALTYKASFHDGFAFYPFLGPAYPENLPWRWRTQAVSAGGVDLLGTAPARSTHGPWRYELAQGNVTERYDVRDEGVEQSFVIHARPSAPGDLVVRGAITTALRCAAASPASPASALVFADVAGTPLVRYGEAVAIDALGRRTPVHTRCDGSSLTLTVPAADVARAAFPLTIDPLISRVVLATWGGTGFGIVSRPEVGHEARSSSTNVMTFYSRQFAATDYDGYARLNDNDLSPGALVFTDVTVSWSTERADVAFSKGADRWVLAMHREFATTVRVRVHFHDRANTTLNSGLTVSHDPSGNESNWFPAVGGTTNLAQFNEALLVYQADVTATKANTANSKVYSVAVDCWTRTMGTRAEVRNAVADADNEAPDVNPESDGDYAPWLVVFEQLNNAIVGDDVDIAAARVNRENTIRGLATFGPTTGTPPHKRQPRVAGRDGEYCVSMIRSNSRAGNFGAELVVERFSWPNTASSPTRFSPRILVADASNPNLMNGGIAFDDTTFSHWGLVYQRGNASAGDVFVLRVGQTGAVTESATLYSGPAGAFAPAIAFNRQGREFICVYASNDANAALPLYGQRLVYPPDAITQPYGTSCGPATISSGPALAGNRNFAVLLAGGAQPSVLMVSLAPAATPLDFAGLTGCVAAIDLSPGVYLTALPPSVFTYAFLPLPDAPLFLGDLYMQWVYNAPGLNPAGLGVTRGLRAPVR